jgi:hypothetical protein
MRWANDGRAVDLQARGGTVTLCLLLNARLVSLGYRHPGLVIQL